MGSPENGCFGTNNEIWSKHMKLLGQTLKPCEEKNWLLGRKMKLLGQKMNLLGRKRTSLGRKMKFKSNMYRRE